MTTVPHGQAVPGSATAAVLLGRLSAVGTAALGLLLLSYGGVGLATALAAALAAGGLAVGTRQLLAGQSRALLMASGALATVAVTAAALLDDELRSDGLVGVLLWLLIVLPFPVTTVVLAGLPRVSDRLAAGRRD